MTARFLFLGYGNPGRQDDGLGPALADRVAELELADVTVDSGYQLNIEDAAAMAEHEAVLFVDASTDCDGPYDLCEVASANEITFTSHTLSPESLMAICEDHFDTRPKAWVLGVRGYEFDFAEGLSRQASANLEKALAFVQSFIQNWKEKRHG